MKLGRVHYRVYGFALQPPTADAQGEFVLVIGCSKWGGPSATKLAGRIALCLKRRFMEFGEGKTREHI